MMEEVDIRIREAWLAENRTKLVTWDQLAHRTVVSRLTEQDFWRAAPNRGGNYSDDDLLELGHLVRFGKNRLIHIAYIPWNRFGQISGKSSWGANEWYNLTECINAPFSRYSSELNNYEWRDITVSAQDAEKFLRSVCRNCHFYGNLSADRLKAENLS